MSEKLGYTWYPKDWSSSDAVFELTLIERGLYRELIDMAMMNGNNTIISSKTWARKFGSTEDEIEDILITLIGLNLIEIKDDKLFIPSCERRLVKVNANKKNGVSGGRPKKPKENPTNNPTNNPNETQHERQRERERENKKEIEIKTEEELSDLFQEFFNSPTSDAMIKNNCQLHHLEEKAIRKRMKDYWLQKSFIFEANKSIHDIRSHFTNWLKLDLKANPPFRINQ
jgi:hypothetical protein